MRRHSTEWWWTDRHDGDEESKGTLFLQQQRDYVWARFAVTRETEVYEPKRREAW